MGYTVGLRTWVPETSGRLHRRSARCLRTTGRNGHPSDVGVSVALYLIRHTPVDAPDGAIYGQREVDLHPDWQLHFEQLRNRLPANVSRVLTSPLGRCQKLANWLVTHRWPSLAPEIRAELKEMSFGRWQGLTWSTVPRAELDAWARDWVHRAPPGGETYLQVRDRWRRLYQSVLELPGDTLVVTHAGLIRVALTDYLHCDPRMAFSWSVAFGEVFRLGT
ncbi:MAG: hypothetical protein D6758_05505 [Gammaproteobacteria bacterium]|nr:MAG: hypothetical protein D6758_05505 [Gammaproteobacteria bacterium]